MKRTALTWSLRLLRYGLCAAAIVFLYRSVSWYDYIRLVDPPVRVRLIEQKPDGFVVWLDGRVQTIGPERVRMLDDGLPDVTYGLGSVVRRIDARKALLAILLFAPVPFLAAVRLVWMLRIQDVHLTLWDSIKLTFAGNFFNFALPGTTGGDLIKAWYVTHHTQHKTEAVTTVFLDRVVGLLGLMILASVILTYAWNRIPWPLSYRSYLAMMLAGVWCGLVVLAVVVYSRRLRHALKLPEIAAALPGGSQLLRIGRATVAMRRHKTLVLMSLGITIVLQLLVIISAFVMARALGMRGSFELYFICVPIGFLIAAIPIAPPQAIGVMESAYVIFFTHDGLNSASVAVTFALAVRLIQLVWALPGVLVPILGAHLPSKRELSELDETDEAAPQPAPSSAETP